jgi:thiol-disulfide isomerase/thioredoxin
MKRTYFFSAPWCASCPGVKMTWLKAIRNYPDIERHEIDMTTDEGRAMAKRYGFRAVPTILLLNHDDTVHEMWTSPGTMSQTDFETKLFHWR